MYEKMLERIGLIKKWGERKKNFWGFKSNYSYFLTAIFEN